MPRPKMTRDEVMASAARRIEKNSEPAENGCRIWTGYRNPNGYGYITMGAAFGRRVSPVHRIVAELAYGPPPDGAHTCHSCDNRTCVSADHIRWCTATDNMRDRYMRNSHSSWGEEHPGAKYGDDVFLEALRLWDEGEMTRTEIAEHLGVNYITCCLWIRTRKRSDSKMGRPVR